MAPTPINPPPAPAPATDTTTTTGAVEVCTADDIVATAAVPDLYVTVTAESHIEDVTLATTSPTANGLSTRTTVFSVAAADIPNDRDDDVRAGEAAARRIFDCHISPRYRDEHPQEWAAGQAAAAELYTAANPLFVACRRAEAVLIIDGRYDARTTLVMQGTVGLAAPCGETEHFTTHNPHDGTWHLYTPDRAPDADPGELTDHGSIASADATGEELAIGFLQGLSYLTEDDAPDCGGHPL